MAALLREQGQDEQAEMLLRGVMTELILSDRRIGDKGACCPPKAGRNCESCVSPWLRHWTTWTHGCC